MEILRRNNRIAEKVNGTEWPEPQRTSGALVPGGSQWTEGKQKPHPKGRRGGLSEKRPAVLPEGQAFVLQESQIQRPDLRTP